MPRYFEVEWSRANCSGIDVDMFYRLEELRKVDYELYVKPLRSICTACPLWAECLAYGMKYESYGVWGGMTTEERAAMNNGKNLVMRVKLYQEFQKFGVTREMLNEAVDSQ